MSTMTASPLVVTYPAHDVGGAGRAPVVPVQATFRHSSAAGFCTVCGGVWPCARAGEAAGHPAAPTPHDLRL